MPFFIVASASDPLSIDFFCHKSIEISKLAVNDVVIAVMGPTGSGKSNLIDKLTGDSNKRSGHKLESFTEKVQAVCTGATTKGARIILVDTPGFDDTKRTDMEILDMIANWLSSTYKKDVKLSGILYLHRISDNRMAGSPQRNLRMFGELCGDNAAQRVVLVTTMWDRVSQETGLKREDELKEKFWKAMIEKQSLTGRFLNTAESAQQLIQPFVLHGEKEIVLLQEELVDLKKRLNETEAGKTLYTALQSLLASQKETIRLLTEQATTQNNSELVKELETEYKKVELEFEQTFAQMKTLKVSIGRRILLTFLPKKAHAHPVKLG